MRRIFIALAIATLPWFALSETYRDIGPLDTLGDVKAKFPNAQVKKLSPAWAQSTDALYQFTGPGLSGTIIIKFTDARPEYKKDLETNANEARTAPLQLLANQTDDDALGVNWVRWVPEAPFPVQRLISKYGSPEVSAFSDEEYEPYRRWIRKGLTAFLADDEKKVTRIDFLFTADDNRRAWMKKFNFVPDHLKEEVVPQKKK
jgi:hypothetical protein